MTFAKLWIVALFLAGIVGYAAFAAVSRLLGWSGHTATLVAMPAGSLLTSAFAVLLAVRVPSLLDRLR